MNNLMLSFSGAELSRLRTLVTAVGKEIGLVPGGNATAESKGPKTALDTTWSHLVEMLDLGTEPEMRECPECKRSCMGGASRCGHCWAVLPPLKLKAKTDHAVT
jgi:hypothetical protein